MSHNNTMKVHLAFFFELELNGYLLSTDNSTSIVSVTSILLVLIAVLLSTLTSYCLLQRYRRARPDDTEIEYLTGDELLYFHTPSPHLKSSHRSSRLDSEDGTFWSWEIQPEKLMKLIFQDSIFWQIRQISGDRKEVSLRIGWNTNFSMYDRVVKII